MAMQKHSGKVTAYTATATGVTYTVTQDDPPPPVSMDFAVPSPDPRDRALWDAKVNGTDVEVTYDDTDPGVVIAVSG
jgi:hypothetical protein